MSRPKEAALLRDARQFMRATAGQLQTLIGPARALRRKLERTERYRGVAGKDDAGEEPAFDLAGTLEVMLERDLEEMVAYLREGATPRSRTRRHPTSPVRSAHHARCGAPAAATAGPLHPELPRVRFKPRRQRIAKATD